MRVIIIGNGIAGTIASKTLRELNSQVDIDVFAAEKFPYYPRPNLVDFLAGTLSMEKIFAFSENWHLRQRIELHLGTTVRKISPPSQEIELVDGKREKYDVLLLANGASAFLPPINGITKKGVFTLRTLEDALKILDYLQKHPKVAVLGGGLLGLEIARALNNRGAEVVVVEFFDHLLPRQLDPQGAALLKAQLEKMGMEIRLNIATEEIIGRRTACGLKSKNGEEIKAEMIIVAAGVKSNIDIAKEAGLVVEKGIIVNDCMRTNAPKIFSAGDCAQHRGKVYGIIPSSFDQARIAAYNILGQEKKYEGSIPSNTLKVAGVFLTSIGLVNPEGEGFEQLRKEVPETGLYKKLVLQNGALVGAIWMGTKRGVLELNRAISLRRNVEKWKDVLLEDNFDFSLL